MTATEFNDTISRLKRREPFQPFVVEKTDGTLINITHPGVALSGEGGALYITPTDDLVEFDNDGVRTIRQETSEASK